MLMVIWLRAPLESLLHYERMYCAKVSKERGGLLMKIAVACLSFSKDGRLKLAVEADDVARVQKALKEGADPDNQVEREGDTLLIDVCMRHSSHSYEIAKLLLEHGANPNLKDDDGGTALMYATRDRSGKLPLLLLQHGADLNLKDNGGNTALFHAVELGNDKTIQLLLQSGAKIGDVNSSGRTALDLAKRYNHKKVAELLERAIEKESQK
jgi:ankyrin repeat protein